MTVHLVSFENLEYFSAELGQCLIMLSLGKFIKADEHPLTGFGLLVVLLPEVVLRAQGLSVCDVSFAAFVSWYDMVSMYLYAILSAPSTDHTTVVISPEDLLSLLWCKVLELSVVNRLRVVSVDAFSDFD